MTGDTLALEATLRQPLRLLLLLLGLLACSALGEPDLNCPEFVASHAPLVYLHSGDKYMPSDLLAHVRHTTPLLDGEPISGLPSLDLDNLELLNEWGEDVALTSNDDPTTLPDWILGEAPDADGQIHNSTACVVILVERSERDLDAFYFYFYSWNEGPNITQVLEPLNSIVTGPKVEAGMAFGLHVGDWEHNMVRFRDGKPTGVYFSQHVDGASYKWKDRRLSKTDDERPIVYSARGSHANYASPGHQIHNAVLIDYCDAGRKWDPVLSAYFYRFDPETFSVTRLNPPYQNSSSAPSSNLTSLFYFSGRWGDWQYPDDDPRQETIPRFGLKRFETGPNGPRFKHLVRKGLKPDHPRKISWTEWAVKVYMHFYPCCIRGWRVYMSLMFIVAAIVGTLVAIRFAVKRYRARTTYTKLREEEILLDDWERDAEALLSSDDETEMEEQRYRK